MSSIEDPLSKPAWPTVDPTVQETLVNLLVAPCSRGSTKTIKLGFNSTMEALEHHIAGKQHVEVIFVARSDLHPAECLPLALASVAGQVTLATLPKGSTERLNGHSIIALCDGSGETQILQLVKDVGPAKLDWVYQCATAKRKKKTQ